MSLEESLVQQRYLYPGGLQTRPRGLRRDWTTTHMSTAKDEREEGTDFSSCWMMFVLFKYLKVCKTSEKPSGFCTGTANVNDGSVTVWRDNTDQTSIWFPCRSPAQGATKIRCKDVYLLYGWFHLHAIWSQVKLISASVIRRSNCPVYHITLNVCGECQVQHRCCNWEVCSELPSQVQVRNHVPWI